VKDKRVPSFLGRVLDSGHQPVGTCFQVAVGVMVTAWHVLYDIGKGDLGSQVTIDALRDQCNVIQAEVVGTDRVHDLAVLRSTSSIASTNPALTPTDRVPKGSQVAVTGSSEVTDEYTYHYLDAIGIWAGGTVRDEQVALGRLRSEAVMRGMSGAPVLDGSRSIIGIVSGRYNAADGWLRDSVWIARTENLLPLLSEIFSSIDQQRSDLAKSIASMRQDWQGSTASASASASA
jgi:S1-C subfamily serine protease